MGLSRADQRRQKLIDTARKLFIENGFHATGVAQIARDSGIAVGQIYRDFCSKEGIVAALVQGDCTRFLEGERLREAIQAGDDQQVRDWLMRFVEGKDDPDQGRLFAEIVAESSRNPRIASIFIDLQRELRTSILAALTSLAPRSLAAHRTLLADAILTMSLGLHQQQLMLGAVELEPMTRAVQRVIETQLNALRASPGAA